MAYLYRYTCPPNYPVCTAYVLFYSEILPADTNAAMVLARQLASEQGLVHVGTVGETLFHLGKFEPSGTFKFDQVLAFANGEY